MSCVCSSCGKKYKVDLNIPDELWQQISKDQGLMCGCCIMKSIENLSNYNVWHLINEKSIDKLFYNIINGEGLTIPRQLIKYTLDKMLNKNARKNQKIKIR